MAKFDKEVDGMPFVQVKISEAIEQKCKEYDIDITQDLIPVAPAAHYFMGGVKTNIRGESSVKGLYAIGEVSSTGLHGGNRLASNSLLECVVCAYEVAEYLKNIGVNDNADFETNEKFNSIISKYEQDSELKPVDVKALKEELQATMWSGVGIFRNEQVMKSAQANIEKLSKEFDREDKCLSKDEYELRNMLITAELIVKSALNRKESRGAHYRVDYLNTNEVCEHSLVDKNK